PLGTSSTWVAAKGHQCPESKPVLHGNARITAGPQGKKLPDRRSRAHEPGESSLHPAECQPRSDRFAATPAADRRSLPAKFVRWRARWADTGCAIQESPFPPTNVRSRRGLPWHRDFPGWRTLDLVFAPGARRRGSPFALISAENVRVRKP